MAAGYDGSIRIDTSIDSKGFNVGVKGIVNGLKGLAAAVGIAFGVGALVNFGKAAVVAASNVEEMRNKFQVVFRGLASDVERQLGDFASATNSSKSELMGFAATMQDTFVPLGFAREQAANLSVQVVELATDLGSFNNLPTAQVVQDIQGALVGQVETVRKYGIVLNQDVIQQKALAMGLWNGTGAMSAQARAAASLQLIMEGNADAQGDATRTAGSFANQMRGLQAAFEEFKIAIGNAIIPVLTPIIGVIKNIIQWLTALVQEFAMFIGVLFGVDVGANAMGEIASNAQNAAEATGEMAGNTASAGKAAKGALAAFDQLNVLQQDQGQAGGGGGKSGAGGAGLSVPAPDTSALDKVKTKVEEFKKALLKLLAPAGDAFDRLKKALLPLGETIWAGLKWAWDNILVPLGNWTISNLLPAFLDLFAAGATALNSALTAFAPIGQWLWDNFLLPIATWTGGAIIQVLNWLTTKLLEYSAWIDSDPWARLQQFALDAWLAIQEKWGEVVAWFTDNVIEPVKKWFGKAWDTIVVWAGDAWAGIVAAWQQATDWFQKTIIDPLITRWTSVWDLITLLANDAWVLIKFVWNIASEWFSRTVIDPVSSAFGKAWNAIKTAANTTWSGISGIWTAASTWFSENVITPIDNYFKTTWDAIQGYVSGVWTKVVEIWQGAPKWFQDTIIDPISKAFNTLLNGTDGKSGLKGMWTNTFESIKGIVKGAINSLIDGLNSFLGGAVDGINKLITSVNAFGKNLPGWKAIPTLTTPAIPRLATGAVIPANAQFLAMLGDQRNGRNLEAPESLIRQIVREETQLGMQKITIQFEGNLAELVRTLRPVIAAEDARVGGSLIRVKRLA